MPPALVATFPPIVDHGELAGSGGYHSPYSATMRRRSSLTTPACTTARRSMGSTRSTWFIRSRAITMLPSTAFAPPDRPVPAPRATTGTRCLMHARTTSATSSVDSARMTAIGLPAGAPSPWSLDRPSITSGSMRTRCSGTWAPISSRMVIRSPCSRCIDRSITWAGCHAAQTLERSACLQRIPSKHGSGANLQGHGAVWRAIATSRSLTGA